MSYWWVTKLNKTFETVSKSEVQIEAKKEAV